MISLILIMMVIGSIQYIQTDAVQGQAYYTFDLNENSAQQNIFMNLFSPINIFFGLIIGLGILNFSIYAIKKKTGKYNIDEAFKTFYALLALSGLGLVIFGLIDLIFIGRDAIIYPIIGLLFLFAGGKMLTNEDEIKSKSEVEQ